MQTRLKFLLALGGAKLVMLNDGRGNSFYAVAAPARRALKTDLVRIANALEKQD
ncbi:MAG: hypothetical protein LBG16_00220 [Elusimicrobiota bacterium]|jgi:hypothetical protein|nr:hypothetical protein [Elusimicrobiota bacterium]